MHFVYPFSCFVLVLSFFRYIPISLYRPMEMDTYSLYVATDDKFDDIVRAQLKLSTSKFESSGFPSSCARRTMKATLPHKSSENCEFRNVVVWRLFASRWVNSNSYGCWSISSSTVKVATKVSENVQTNSLNINSRRFCIPKADILALTEDLFASRTACFLTHKLKPV